MSTEEREQTIGATVEREADGVVGQIRDVWGDDAVIVWPNLQFSLVAVADLVPMENAEAKQ